MAEYGLKYTAEAGDGNGEKVILHISQKNWTGGVYTLASLRSFSLDIQGSQADIAAPIIKTAVNIALVDAFDEGATDADGTECVKDGGKWGRWEEFYTPDPFMFKVELIYDGVRYQRAATMWTGFITPDSWAEEMTYRGVINLTARDMLGYLDELEFDWKGERIDVRDIILRANEAIRGDLAYDGMMQIDWDAYEMLYNQDTDESILTSDFAASVFAGGTWYAALEKSLEALGLVIRYNGDNGFVCTTIRHATDICANGEEYPFDCVFIAGSGHRTLDPAVRKITDIFSPKDEARKIRDPWLGNFNPTSGTLATSHPVTLEGESPTTADFTIPKFNLNGNESPGEIDDWWGDLAAPSSSAAIAEGVLPRTMLVACDVTTANVRLMHKIGYNIDLAINAEALYNRVEGRTDNNTWILADGTAHRVSAIIAIVTAYRNGSFYRYLNSNGSWTGSADDIVLTIRPGEPLHIPGGLDLATDRVEMRVQKVVTENTAAVGDPLYAVLGFSEMTTDDEVAREYRVVTSTEANGRTEITRKPEIGCGPMGTDRLAYYPNLIAPVDLWYWLTDPLDPDAPHIPLAAWVHLQILTNRIQQNGMSVFTGDFVTGTGEAAMPMPGLKYTYYGRKCVLIAGTLDFTARVVRGAILREYADWDEVWDEQDLPTFTRYTSYDQGGTAIAEDTTGGGPGDFNADFSLDYHRWPWGMVPADD